MPTENYVAVPAGEYRNLIMAETNASVLKGFLKRAYERGYGASHDEIRLLWELFAPAESGEEA